MRGSARAELTPRRQLTVSAWARDRELLPRLLGSLVIVAGWAYVIDSLVYFVFPHQAAMVALVSTLPQGVGELGFTAWMMIKGVNPNRGMDAAA